MPQPHRETFSIAASGTASNGRGGNGKRLVALYVPTMDSTTIQFEASTDGGSTWDDIFTNSGTPAAVTLGTANTGSAWQAVPEDVGRISAVAEVRLKTAAQSGGARTLIGLWEAP